MSTKNPRIAFVPTDDFLSVISDLADVSGKTKASLVAEILDTATPILRDQLQAYRAIAESPEKAKSVLQEYANKATADIAQAVMEFEEPKRGRRRAKSGG